MSEQEAEFWLIHMPEPWPHGGAARTLVAPARIAPPGTGWRVLMKGTEKACRFVLEQSLQVKELEAKLSLAESKLDRVGKLFDERYAELPDHVFDEMCNALERFPHSFHG